MKRVLSLLLVAAMLLAIPVMPIGAKAATNEVNITDPKSQCPCCGVPMNELTWIPFDAGIGSTPPAGHYYLAADYNQTSVKSVMAWDKVVLDLRGHKWSSYTTTVMPAASSYRLMTVSGYFYLMDTAGGGVVEAQMKGNYGGAFLTDENEHPEPMIHILSGTIRPRPGDRAATNGGLIYAYESGIIKMTGGVIENGEAVSGEGGAILGGANSQILIHGGMIRNCKAKTNGGAIKSAGKVEIKNASILNCYAERDGGAVYGTKSVTIENATIAANSCGRWGGGVAQAGGTLKVTDSLIDGNAANYTVSYYNGGGNVYAASGAVVTLENSAIKDGYSANQGGNIYVSGSTLKLINSTVTGGVAKTGDNLKNYQGTTVIDSSDILGDTIIENGTLTLKGDTKIGLHSAGLVVYKTPTVNASELTDGADIYVQHVTSGGTVAAAGANIAYFKGAYRSVLSGGGVDPIVATIAADGETAGYCPHCNTQVAWTAYSGQTTSGHYYMAANRTASTTIPAAADIVLDLNGKVLTGAATSRALTNSGKLTIVDSGVGSYDGTTQWNGGMIQSGGNTGYNGGVVFNNGTLNVYGGTLRYVKDSRAAQRGGVIYNNGTINLYGGFYDGSAYDNTASTGFVNSGETEQPAGMGGALWTYNGKTTNISAGHFLGGNAYAAGTAGFGANVKVKITGGTFHGGKSVSEDSAYGGGNLFFMGTADNGNVQVSNITVTGGEATTYGGNIYFGRYTTNTFDNIIVAGGKTTGEKGYGGNAVIYGAGTTTIKNSTFLAGTAFAGGNIHVSNTGASVTFDTCRLYNGTTTGGTGSNGGNVLVSGGSLTIQGGALEFGRGGNSTAGVGGNICCGGSGTVTVQKNDANEVTTILGGTAKFGGNITVMGKVTLTDAQIGGGAVFSGGVGKDVQISGASANLTAGTGLTGNISVWPKEGSSLTYGQIIGATTATTLSDEANIIIESVSGTPKVVAKDGALYVAGVQVVDSEGNAQWCADFAEAAAQDGYVKLYADMDLTLTEDTFVDLNGNNVTVSGSGKLLGMDSSGDDYALPAGALTFEGESPVADKTMVHAPNGKLYVALVEDNTVSFHRLGADLINVTINVDRSGVRFKGAFGADEKLKDMIANYGIAVSVKNMPDNTFENAIKAEFEGNTMVNGETASSVTITNIFRSDLDAAVNHSRGQQKIYASSFVVLKDGSTVYMGDQAETNEDDVAWSLKDTLVTLDELIENDPTNFRRYTNTMRAYYSTWKDSIGDWLAADNSFVTPEEDDVIDILMIGSSFCTYYVQELWEIANAAGLKVRVCNVYYSGCPLSKYYTDWVNGDAAYQFYETTGPERTSFPGSKTLEWCLAQGEWDVISMQEYTGNIRNDTAEAHLEKTDLYTDTLFPYISSEFPNAKFYFHQTWSFQKGYDRNGYTVTTAAKQAEDTYNQQQFALGLLRKYGDPATSGVAGSEFQCMDGRVPTGEAWQLVRDGWGGYAPYDDLCKRTGTASNLGDYYHDGDLGGGQYLNALTWFFRIMKDRGVNLTVEDIQWQPSDTTYGVKLADGLNFDQLKACAWEAVYGNGWTYNAANYQ